MKSKALLATLLLLPAAGAFAAGAGDLPLAQADPSALPAWFNLTNGLLALAGLAAFVVSFDCWFIIHTKQAGIVERFGKFHRVAEAGLNFKIPVVEKMVYVEDLSMQLMDVPVMSKTHDDATVTVPVRVQFFVLPDRVKEAYYELDDPNAQIQAHVENVILSYIPKIQLDETYKQEDLIAARIKESLSTVMAKFGYAIENALVTKIVPADAVVNAMNDINAARREKVAAEARAEAKKITLVKQAEAQAEATALHGQGLARQRQAIVDGLRKSVESFQAGVKEVSAHDVMALVMMTQYFDALRDIGATSNTILLPHSPSATQDLFQQMRNAITTGVLTASKAEGALPPSQKTC